MSYAAKRCLGALVLAAAGIPAAAATGAPKQRVVRTWQDTIKTPAGEVARRVEVVFDYTRGVAYENAYDASGKPLSQVVLDRQPRPSPEEIQDAIAILRADASLGRILARTGAVPEGGFVLEEPEGSACGPHTRCLQILVLSPDRHGLQRRVVVDLTKRAIAYRAYVPSDMEKAR